MLKGEKEKARKKLKDRLAEVTAHRFGVRFQGPRQERVTVDELLGAVEQDYVMHGRKSLPQLRSHLRHIKDFFAMDRVVTVDRLIEGFVG